MKSTRSVAWLICVAGFPVYVSFVTCSNVSVQGNVLPSLAVTPAVVVMSAGADPPTRLVLTKVKLTFPLASVVPASVPSDPPMHPGYTFKLLVVQVTPAAHE